MATATIRRTRKGFARHSDRDSSNQHSGTADHRFAAVLETNSALEIWKVSSGRLRTAIAPLGAPLSLSFKPCGRRSTAVKERASAGALEDSRPFGEYQVGLGTGDLPTHLRTGRRYTTQGSVLDSRPQRSKLQTGHETRRCLAKIEVSPSSRVQPPARFTTSLWLCPARSGGAGSTAELSRSDETRFAALARLPPGPTIEDRRFPARQEPPVADEYSAGTGSRCAP